MADRPLRSKRCVQAGAWQLLFLAGCVASPALSRAQEGSYATAGQPSIYTCVDARGQRISSDRPIAECMATGQRELRASGELKRVLAPVLTASERAEQAKRLEQEASLQAQLKAERRQDRALVLRYPNPAAHAKARAEWLAQQDVLIAATRMRQAELERQGQSIAAKLEFYQKDPDQAPAGLRQLEQENARQRALQSTQLEAQLRERERTEQHLDQELARLRQLWPPAAR